MEQVMITKTENTIRACRQIISEFFAKHPNIPLQSDVERVLELLLVNNIPMSGKPAGWAGGIIYAAANFRRIPCGIPGLLNHECEEFFHVSMDTIKRRAAKITPLLEAVVSQAIVYCFQYGR